MERLLTTRHNGAYSVLLANGVRQLAGLDGEPWAVPALPAAASL